MMSDDFAIMAAAEDVALWLENEGRIKHAAHVRALLETTFHQHWLKQKRRADAVEASLATANAEIARLRAEGEAKDRALKVKAEEQVAYWRERQRAEKCLEDGVSEDGSSYTPIGDEAAWQGGYCNGRMSDADWWAKTFQYWPNEAARAAPARSTTSAGTSVTSSSRRRCLPLKSPPFPAIR